MLPFEGDLDDWLSGCINKHRQFASLASSEHAFSALRGHSLTPAELGADLQRRQVKRLRALVASFKSTPSHSLASMALPSSAALMKTPALPCLQTSARTGPDNKERSLRRPSDLPFARQGASLSHMTSELNSSWPETSQADASTESSVASQLKIRWRQASGSSVRHPNHVLPFEESAQPPPKGAKLPLACLQKPCRSRPATEPISRFWGLSMHHSPSGEWRHRPQRGRCLTPFQVFLHQR